MATQSERIYEILLIEDSPADVELAKHAWSECKAVRSNIAVLENSKDAIAYLRSIEPFRQTATPDLILLDYKMPINGGVALTEIKGDPEYLHIPVLVLSGSVNSRDYLDAYRRQANCCYQKPNKLAEFIDLVCHIADAWLLRAVLPKP